MLSRRDFLGVTAGALGILFGDAVKAADDRNDEVVAQALARRQPHIGPPPNPEDFIASYEWEADLFGTRDPTCFWKAGDGLPQWWEDWWFENCWLDYPTVYLPKFYEKDGEKKPAYHILAFDSPEEWVKRWCDMQEEQTDGALFYGCSEELQRAIISNPNLRKLAVRWRKKHGARG